MALTYFDKTTVRDCGVTYSCDMVRLVGRFIHEDEERKELPFDMGAVWHVSGPGRVAALSWISAQGEAAKLDYDYTEYHGNKIGKFRDLWQFTFGPESSAALMACPRLGTGRSDWLGWCLEFNPNKVGYDSGFQELLRCLVRNSSHVEVKRWDFAVDFPVIRQAAVLVKDRRLYQSVRDGTEDLTEYLGRRNVPGFCKLYNKALERNIPGPLTRLEVTLPDCDFDEMSDFWPPCHIFASLNLTQVEAINSAAAELTPAQLYVIRSVVQYPALENELFVFGYRQKKRLDEILSQFRQAVVPPVGAYESVVSGVREFSYAQF